MSLHYFTILLLAVLLIAALLATETGYQLGRLYGPRDEDFSKQLGLVQGAVFALLAFLIGFAFSGASTRYIERQDVIVKEANALGTAWLRADVLPEPPRSALKAALREYTEDRVAMLRRLELEDAITRLTKVPALHTRMWNAAIEGTTGNAPLMQLVLPVVNEVIDLHTVHLSAVRRHIPYAILITLMIGAALSLVLAAFGNGQARRRYSGLNFVYGFMLSVALWITVDLDYPYFGLIRGSILPLAETLSTMK